MQLQVVGLPNRLEGAIKPAFMDVGSSMQIQFDEVPDHANLAQMAEPGMALHIFTSNYLIQMKKY